MLKPALSLRLPGCLLLLAVSFTTHAQETVFPGKDWLEATPESQGLDAAKLRAAVKFPEEHAGSDGVRELVIVRHGRSIWKGDGIDKRHGVWSCTKSFTSTVLGLLAADGKCSPDTRAAELVPELKAVYPAVTLRHFTTMTSGYRAVGDETWGAFLGRTGGAMMALAQAGPEAAARPVPVKPVQRGFQNRVFKDAQGVERKYVLFIPYKLEAGARPPLLMFLHGSGERGDNGLDQVMVGLGPALWKQKANFPFITIFPQCHTNGNWLVDGPDAQTALAMFRAVAAEFNTDPDRAYLTGLSMGGSGSWSIAAKHPDLFAAIVPMCGRGELAAAKTLAAARLPVWNFCGDKDREATVQFCRDMHAALQAAGGSSQYTEYPGVGHNCWDNAYGTAELYKWLLEQSRAKNRR